MTVRWVLPIVLVAACKHARPVTVGAAISLKESMDDLAPRLEKTSGRRVDFAFGASGDLASQMARGAPFDVLVAAGEEPRLAGVADDACTLAWNTLALVRRRGSAADVTWTTLARVPAGFRLAVGLVPQVPAGVYAEAALTKLGEWDAVAPRVVRGANVRAVLDLVARGEADAGIVYATDVRIRPDVESLGDVPAAARPDVHYPVYVAKSATADGRALAKLLCDDASRRVLASHGFLDRAP